MYNFDWEIVRRRKPYKLRKLKYNVSDLIELKKHKTYQEIAKNLAKKQIPKKPKEFKENKACDVELNCGNCHCRIIAIGAIYNHKYCEWCGQAIDWEDKQ